MMGLRQKILSSASESDVAKLLTEGKTYEFASKRTRSSWNNAARRIASGEKYIPTVVEKPKSKKKARRTRL